MQEVLKHKRSEALEKIEAHEAAAECNANPNANPNPNPTKLAACQVKTCPWPDT